MDRTKLIEAATALTDVQQQLIETIETETAVKLFTARNMPQASDVQRSREILDELLRRAGERFRPSLERDYIERLLKRF